MFGIQQGKTADYRLLMAMGALSCSLLASASGARAASSGQVVRVGSIAPLPVYWALYLAKDTGLFDKAGVKVEITKVHNDSDCIRALVAGSMDACTSGIDGVVRASDTGSDVRVVAGLLNKNPTYLLGKKDITAASQLKGKTLAVLSPAGGSTNAVFAMLADAGLKRGEYDLISVGGSSSRFAALSSGQVDATILPPPNAYSAIDKGFTVLGNAAQTPNSYYGQAIVGRPGLSAEYDAKMKKFIGAVGQATDWLLDPKNKKAAIEKLSNGSIKMSLDYAERTYQLIVEQHTAIPAKARLDPSVVANVIRLLDTYSSYKAKSAPKDYIDNRYLGAT